MKERLTRQKDNFPCRFKGGCPAEEWIKNITDVHYSDWKEDVCDNCPFEKYINKLAEYEDMEERIEDDLK